jgi:hypothetical protein
MSTVLDMEVKSSGPGPRAYWHGTSDRWTFRWVWTASQHIGRWWTRVGPDRKGRMRPLSDGVAIIIRRAG